MTSHDLREASQNWFKSKFKFIIKQFQRFAAYKSLSLSALVCICNGLKSEVNSIICHDIVK